jgi:uncharacterized membrane protein
MSRRHRNNPPRNLTLHQQQPKKMAIQVTAQSSSGPLPHPAILAQYNEIVPGAAERIIAMAEVQTQHRQQLEKAVIESDIRNSRLGLHYGLIIGLVAVLGGVACIVMGHEVGGSIVGGTGLTGLVGVFVYGSRQKQKEREALVKAEMMPEQRQ